ncbi:MAG: signal peptidase I [Candidatus Omnitrophica bacterium]|nr:signal peptidase I [Candidatus Omnitrophota bacterium]
MSIVMRRKFFDFRFVRRERRRPYRLAFILFWSILLWMFVHRFVISSGVVSDYSMVPTLRDGDIFLINKYLYFFRPPQRGDIVVLRLSPWSIDWYVKRIIAVEGETILIRKGRVYINGQLLRESYGDYTAPNLGPATLGPGMYYVMGDNRLNSFDSRNFGPVHRSRIEGRIKPGELFAFR